jgi:hypothetical protein
MEAWASSGGRLHGRDEILGEDAPDGPYGMIPCPHPGPPYEASIAPDLQAFVSRTKVSRADWKAHRGGWLPTRRRQHPERLRPHRRPGAVPGCSDHSHPRPGHRSPPAHQQGCLHRLLRRRQEDHDGNPALHRSSRRSTPQSPISSASPWSWAEKAPLLFSTMLTLIRYAFFSVAQTCSLVQHKQAVSIAQVGLFFNCGQCCIASSRVFVHENIYDAFIGRTPFTLPPHVPPHAYHDGPSQVRGRLQQAKAAAPDGSVLRSGAGGGQDPVRPRLGVH